MIISQYLFVYIFFFNVTATTEIYTLSLHDALPILDRTSISRSFFFLAYDSFATANSSTTILIDDVYLVSYMATGPSPDDGAVNIGLTPTLIWAPGVDANAHDVYFGEDQNAVMNADISDLTGVYQGRQNLNLTSFNPCCLEEGITYYWRIDEITDTTIWQGTVWNFTIQGSLGTYSNPVISEIGPGDPTVIYYQGKYYMYPTGDNTSYHVYTSYDLVNWTKGSRVFQPGGINVWAPDVYYNSDEHVFAIQHKERQLAIIFSSLKNDTTGILKNKDIVIAILVEIILSGKLGEEYLQQGLRNKSVNASVPEIHAVISHYGLKKTMHKL